MKDKKLVAVYARVSTSGKGQDPAMQLRELRQYCKVRGWKIYDEYVDRGISGTREDRPQLAGMMRDCRRRVVSAVVLYRYDRFARSLRQLVNALAEFDSLGIDFISLHEGVDTTTPNGKLIFAIYASLSEFEHGVICQRVRSGLDAARARGQRLGRPPVCRLSREEAEQLRKERTRRKTSLRALARKYKISLWRAHLLCSGKKAMV